MNKDRILSLLIDLNNIGPLTDDDATFLAELIFNACNGNFIRHNMSIAARDDFGWGNSVLAPYIDKGLISSTSKDLYQIVGYAHNRSYHLENGCVMYLQVERNWKWIIVKLCWYAYQQDTMRFAHRIILVYTNMSFINLNMDITAAIYYKSGKNLWSNGPYAIKKNYIRYY